ncbi:MAG: CRISPR-associated endonuclease Cas1 [Smithella sp.]
MGSVYILSDHGKLVKQNDALTHISASGEIRKIFLHRTDRIVISGNIEITGSALRMLMHQQIDTVFLSSNGRFNGKLEFEEGKNVFLRKRQYDSLNNVQFMLKAARSIAAGKISNQVAFMQRINRKGSKINVESAIAQARRNQDALSTAQSVDSIRGHEGMGSKLYFSVFRQNINPEWAIFKGRSMNPPRDNVNAVMSFLYTLLMYRVDAFIEMEGLDPYVGYLHTLEYGKRSLTFDLMEEYRTSICDTLTCALFNLGILVPEDFEVVDFSATNDDAPLSLGESDEHDIQTIETDEEVKGVLLSKTGARKVAEKFEEKMDTLILYPPENERLSYEKVIANQVNQFRRFLENEEAEYKPFVIR